MILNKKNKKKIKSINIFNILNNKILFQFFILFIIFVILFTYYLVLSKQNNKTSNSKKDSKELIYDTVVLGKTHIYIDDEEKKYEPITWYIADETNNSYLLISKDIILSIPYANMDIPIDWEHSLMRAYLNTVYIKDAFTDEERKNIIKTNIKNSNINVYGLSNGRDTEDYMFLLNNEEVYKYLSLEKEVGVCDLYKLSGVYKAYWTRDVGFTQYDTCYANSKNEIIDYGSNANTELMGVRPCLWVKKNMFKDLKTDSISKKISFVKNNYKKSQNDNLSTKSEINNRFTEKKDKAKTKKNNNVATKSNIKRISNIYNNYNIIDFPTEINDLEQNNDNATIVSSPR